MIRGPAQTVRGRAPASQASCEVAAGTPVANHLAMAAVFALIFLFVCASIGFMVKALPDTWSFGTVAMLVTFIAMASGIFIGLFKLARRWEDEEATGE